MTIFEIRQLFSPSQEFKISQRFYDHELANRKKNFMQKITLHKTKVDFKLDTY